MSKAFFIDTTLCMGCRGCQVACKQWHGLPAEITHNRGTYQNPPDLSFDTYKLVRMKEVLIDGKLKWLFFPDQCRHCLEPPCLEAVEDASVIYQDPDTGAVLYTANTRYIDGDAIRELCPYNVPRKAPDGTLAKCDMCNDRVRNGLEPACVKTCPSGAMNFGDRADILKQAHNALAAVRKSNPKARLIDEADVSVIYLVAEDPLIYYDYAIAAATYAPGRITRQAALRRMVRPLTRAMAQLG